MMLYVEDLMDVLRILYETRPLNSIKKEMIISSDSSLMKIMKFN